MSRTAPTTLEFDRCCGQTAPKDSNASGLLARLFDRIRPSARLPRLDVEVLSDHQLRDLGLAEARALRHPGLLRG